MSYSQDIIEERFPMLTPLERAIMRMTQEKNWHLLRYSDLNANKIFMKKINQRMLQTSDGELTAYIRNDIADNALHRFLYLITYHDGTSVLSPGWVHVHIFIVINLCFAVKARKTLAAFLHHQYIRDNLVDMISTGVFIDIRRKQNIFNYVDAVRTES
jgi:hypothetical protein